MFTHIKHYRILRELGGGGFATVYLARDDNLKRDVAIKVMHAVLARDDNFRRFFEREARLVASLERLAVVPVYDYGEIDGQLYLVMSYMPGGTLADRLEQGGKAVTLAEVVRLFERLAPTLDRIHARGIVHRDLKPSNILYDEAGEPYIADFGIARMAQATTRYTGSGMSFGTPQYSSPEQVTGETELDPRSDIYTLGIIVYELLTGEYPFWSDTPLGWVYKHLEAPVPEMRAVNSRLPRGVQDVVEGMLAKARDERYPSVSAVLEDLKRAQAGIPVVFKVRRNRKQGATIALPRGQYGAPPTPAARLSFQAAAAAVVLVLAALSIVVWQNRGAGAPATGAANAPSATASQTAAPTRRATPTAEAPGLPGGTPRATGTAAASSTPAAEPSPTSSVTESPAPTGTPVPTESPLPAPTATRPPQPTATLSPTAAPAPTSTPRPAATSTPPPPTQAPAQSAIGLLEPGNDAIFSSADLITFRWSGGGPLQGSQYYDVRVWREGAPHYGVTAAYGTQATLSAGSLGSGTFYWSVAVVDNGGAVTVVDEAPARRFTVTGGGDDPGPNPTVTAPPY